MSRSSIFLKIKERLQEKLPHLQYIDLQKGQFERIQENITIPLPAVLIEFKPVTWTNPKKNYQIGETEISICLYTGLISEDYTETENNNETIEFLNKQGEIFNALQGFSTRNAKIYDQQGNETGNEFSGGYIKPLDRVREQTEQNDKYSLICFRTDFSTAFYEYINKTEKIIPTPPIEFSLNYTYGKN